MPGLESAPLTSDRLTNETRKFCSTPVGGKVAVRICADASDPIPVSLVANTPGLAVQKDDSRVSTPGAQQTLISFTVPIGKTHELKRLNISRLTCNLIELSFFKCISLSTLRSKTVTEGKEEEPQGSAKTRSTPWFKLTPTERLETVRVYLRPDRYWNRNPR